MNIPPEAWIGLIGVMAGSIVSGVAALLTNRSNNFRLKLQLEHERQTRLQNTKRERLEELHVLVDNWSKGIAVNAISLMAVMHGKLEYNDHLDLSIKNGKKQKGDYSRLQMIVDIYAPQLKECYNKAQEELGKINKISAEHKKAYQLGDTDGGRFLSSYYEAQTGFQDASDELKKQIARLAMETLI